MAESERSSSDPMNLLVNTSVGMWFAEYINASNADILTVLHCFFDFIGAI